MTWNEPTGLTVAYCLECYNKDNVKAFMDITQEWMTNNNKWNRTIKCKKCFREVEQIVNASILFDLALSHPEQLEEEE